MIEDVLTGVEAGYRGGFAVVVGVDRYGDLESAMYDHGAHVVVRDLDEISLVGKPLGHCAGSASRSV